MEKRALRAGLARVREQRDILKKTPGRGGGGDKRGLEMGEPSSRKCRGPLRAHRNSRRIVGWSTGESLAAELVLAALAMALRHRRPPAGLLYHSDRGLQYACGDFRAALAAARLVASMSRKANCHDNATMESFWSSDKRECAEGIHPTRRDATAAAFDYDRNLLQPCAAPQRPRLPIPCGL